MTQRCGGKSIALRQVDERLEVERNFGRPQSSWEMLKLGRQHLSLSAFYTRAEPGRMYLLYHVFTPDASIGPGIARGNFGASNADEKLALAIEARRESQFALQLDRPIKHPVGPQHGS